MKSAIIHPIGGEPAGRPDLQQVLRNPTPKFRLGGTFLTLWLIGNLVMLMGIGISLYYYLNRDQDLANSSKALSKQIAVIIGDESQLNLLVKLGVASYSDAVKDTYQQTTRDTDKLINDTFALFPNEDARLALDKTADAHIALSIMDGNAFKLASTGRAAIARELIESSQYADQLNDYNAGLPSALDILEKSLQDVRSRSYQSLVYILAVSAVILSFIVFGWRLILMEITRTNQQLALRSEETEKMVEDRTHQLKEKNQQILASIHYAERIQKSMLESSERVVYAGVNLFFIYRPRDIVSGDFFWVAQQDDIIFVAAVDCTGHGVPGAFLSLLGHNFLDLIVSYQRVTEPSLILGLLHEKIRTRLNQSGEGRANRDGMDVCLCALQTKTGLLEFSGAKRPLYYTTACGDLEICEGDRLSIGGQQREEKRVFTTHQIRLEPGHTFYLTTDGYVDQPSVDNTKLGSLNLKQILKGLASEPVVEKKRRLEELLDRHQNSEPQRDDITLVGIEWCPVENIVKENKNE